MASTSTTVRRDSCLHPCLYIWPWLAISSPAALEKRQERPRAAVHAEHIGQPTIENEVSPNPRPSRCRLRAALSSEPFFAATAATPPARRGP